MPNMIDVTAPDFVEVMIDYQGKIVWVNVDGKCLLRACRIKDLTLVDHRKEFEALYQSQE